MDLEQEGERFFLFEDFHHKLSEAINNFFNREAFVNVTLVCKGELINAHQVVLSASSLLFESILLARSDHNPSIVFPDISKNEMLLILEYIYKGSVSVPKSVLPTFLKTAKYLQIRGLDQEENNNSQNNNSGRDIPPINNSTPNYSPANSSGGTVAPNNHPTPNLSPVLTETNGQNLVVEEGAEPNYLILPEIVEINTEVPTWLTSKQNCSKEDDHSKCGKKVLNPFAKKLRKLTDSDSTVYDYDPCAPGPSKINCKKEQPMITSPTNNDSDIEFIDNNPSVVVISDTQQTAEICRKSQKRRRNLKMTDIELDHVEFSLDDSELIPNVPKRNKKSHLFDDSEEDTAAAPRVVNPVALKNRGRNEDLNHSISDRNIDSNQPVPSKNKYGEELIRSMRGGNEDLNQSNHNRDEDLKQSSRDRFKDSTRSKPLAQPSSSKGISAERTLKQDHCAEVNSKQEPFENFNKMALFDLRNFCVVCNKNKKNIRLHIQRVHNVAPRGKKFYCDLCSKKFAFEKFLKFHKCQAKAKK